MKLTPRQKAERLRNKINMQVHRGVGKGLKAGIIFLSQRVKETMSVPAPKRKTVGLFGQAIYRATTPATVGAPIRLLSGQARRKTSWKMVDEHTAMITCNARSLPTRSYPRGFPYPKYHEEANPAYRGSGKHQFIAPTVKKYRTQLLKIIGRGMREELPESKK